MSLISFVDRLWLLGGMLSRGWKLCTAAFLATQRPNIVRTASDWDLLALLTSIRTQNRIKRFVAGTTYRWISLPAETGRIRQESHSTDNFRLLYSNCDLDWQSCLAMCYRSLAFCIPQVHPGMVFTQILWAVGWKLQVRIWGRTTHEVSTL